MFDSGKTARTLIDEINVELDTAFSVADASYVRWINSLEQMVYGDIIKERKIKTISSPTIPVVLTTSITPAAAESQMRFEDITLVYADDVELKKTVLGNDVFSDIYYKVDNNLGVNRADITELKVIYNVRPVLKTTSNLATVNIMLPVEFLELMASKLKGEAYKLANEDILAAKYINDYNVLIENFKVWVQDKQAKFGV